MNSSIGTKIRNLRILSGLSQEELGKRVGVQRAAINKYEKGTVENIPIKTIERLAEIFDVTPSYLAGWEGVEVDYLALEVKVLQGVSHFYGKDAVELLETYTQLSNIGRKRLVSYSEEVYQLYNEPQK